MAENKVETFIGQSVWLCGGSPQDLHFKTIKIKQMKKIILIALTMLLAHFGVFSQTIYSYYKTSSDTTIIMVKKQPVFTGRYIQASDRFTYPIMMSANGKLYIERISRKTGKSYKQYL